MQLCSLAPRLPALLLHPSMLAPLLVANILEPLLDAYPLDASDSESSHKLAVSFEASLRYPASPSALAQGTETAARKARKSNGAAGCWIAGAGCGATELTAGCCAAERQCAVGATRP